MRYGDWLKTEEGASEHRFPLFLSLISNKVLQDMPGSAENL